jgi:arginine/serine-rich splicing factor 17
MVYPTSPFVTKPVDKWKVKLTLIDFFKTSLSVSVTVPEEDLEIQPLGDLKKRKHKDPVAQGSLSIRDLGFLNQSTRKNNAEEEKEDDAKVLEEKFLDWRNLTNNWIQFTKVQVVHHFKYFS